MTAKAQSPKHEIPSNSKLPYLYILTARQLFAPLTDNKLQPYINLPFFSLLYPQPPPAPAPTCKKIRGKRCQLLQFASPFAIALPALLWSVVWIPNCPIIARGQGQENLSSRVGVGRGKVE